ncbi:MAG: RNA polymerase sigma factor, partial [Bacteroidota bacterium]|nr:RNA polymerase sigma factor [Bacteroidota bacterium]
MTAQEYNQMVDEYADELYRFLLKSMKDESTAQDLVQETFEKVWVNRAKINAVTSKSYLFSTGYHLMIDHVRKHKRIT